MYSEYKDSAENATQIVRQAVPLAAKYHLALNPIVYTVFYQHIAQVNPDLSRELEAVIAQNQVTQERIESLYQTHIYANDLKNTHSISMAVGNIILFAQGAIHRIEGDTKQYSDQLSSASRQLSTVALDQDVESLVTKLLTETQGMHDSSVKLRDELNEANRKIEQMNEEFIRIRHESLTDPLTGLKNRRAFDKEIVQVHNAASISREPLSLLLVDIDHFKNVNDTHGHLLGDCVIKRVAQWLMESVRGKDLIARFGGEEFVLILPETDLRGAASVAENIRSNIAKRTLRHGDKTIGRVTVSVGAVQIKEGESVEGLINRADQALYQAKREGRNRIAVS